MSIDLEWQHIQINSYSGVCGGAWPLAKVQLTQVVSHEVQVPKAESLAGMGIRDGHSPIDINKLEVPKADAALGPHREQI